MALANNTGGLGGPAVNWQSGTNSTWTVTYTWAPIQAAVRPAEPPKIKEEYFATLVTPEDEDA